MSERIRGLTAENCSQQDPVDVDRIDFVVPYNFPWPQHGLEKNGPEKIGAVSRWFGFVG